MFPIKDENPTNSFPFFTLLIIAANVAIFLYQVSLGESADTFILQFAATPYEIVNTIDIYPKTVIPIPATIITSMFLHGGLLHLGGNMLYLWIFGNNIEDALGHFRFLIFYLLCGLIATGAHIISTPLSKVPLVGASGAIAGILGAYLLLYPKAKVHTLIVLIIFIKVVRVPAFFLLSFWFILQVINSMQGGPVAWYAHIGGFLAGFFLIKFFLPKK